MWTLCEESLRSSPFQQIDRNIYYENYGFQKIFALKSLVNLFPTNFKISCINLILPSKVSKKTALYIRKCLRFCLRQFICMVCFLLFFWFLFCFFSSCRKVVVVPNCVRNSCQVWFFTLWSRELFLNTQLLVAQIGLSFQSDLWLWVSSLEYVWYLWGSNSID